MASMDGQKSQIGQFIFITMVLTAIAVLLIAYVWYTGDQAQKNNMAMLVKIAENAGIK